MRSAAVYFVLCVPAASKQHKNIPIFSVHAKKLMKNTKSVKSGYNEILEPLDKMGIKKKRWASERQEKTHIPTASPVTRNTVEMKFYLENESSLF